MGIGQSEELVDVVGNDSEEYLQRRKRKEWLCGGVEKKKSVEKWMMHVSNDINIKKILGVLQMSIQNENFLVLKNDI